MTQRGLKIVLLFLSIAAAAFIFLKVDLMYRGGPVMMPILLISIFAFAVIFTKLRQFARDTVDVSNFLARIFECIERQKIKEAMDVCDQTMSPLARVLKAGIMKYDRPKDEIRDAMDAALCYEIPSLEENLFLLSTVIQIAPLLGLVGTLLGMMKILLVIQAKSALSLAVAVTDVAPGLWEALLCSVAGFMVAIPSLAASHYLTGRVKSFVDEIERSTAELLSFLLERRMPL